MPRISVKNHCHFSPQNLTTTATMIAQNTNRHIVLSHKSRSCFIFRDHDCIFSVTVLARTEKTITVRKSVRPDRVKRCKIAIWDGVEAIKPWGSYSMCPVITAEKMAV